MRKLVWNSFSLRSVFTITRLACNLRFPISLPLIEPRTRKNSPPHGFFHLFFPSSQPWKARGARMRGPHSDEEEREGRKARKRCRTRRRHQSAKVSLALSLFYDRFPPSVCTSCGESGYAVRTPVSPVVRDQMKPFITESAWIRCSLASCEKIMCLYVFRSCSHSLSPLSPPATVSPPAFAAGNRSVPTITASRAGRSCVWPAWRSLWKRRA